MTKVGREPDPEHETTTRRGFLSGLLSAAAGAAAAAGLSTFRNTPDTPRKGAGPIDNIFEPMPSSKASQDRKKPVPGDL